MEGWKIPEGHERRERERKRVWDESSGAKKEIRSVMGGREEDNTGKCSVRGKR